MTPKSDSTFNAKKHAGSVRSQPRLRPATCSTCDLRRLFKVSFSLPGEFSAPAPRRRALPGRRTEEPTGGRQSQEKPAAQPAEARFASPEFSCLQFLSARLAP